MINAIIEEPIYGTKTFVFFDITDKKSIFIDSIIKKYNVFTEFEVTPTKEIFDKGSLGYTRILDNCIAIVCFKAKKPNPSIIAHEALHLACKYLYPKGLELTQGEEEAYAYFIAFFVGETHKAIKTNKKIKLDKKNY